jgi:hypothetical protein
MTRILLSMFLVGTAACAADPASDPSATDDPGAVGNPTTSSPNGDGSQDVQSFVLMGAEAQCLSDGPCSPACSAGMVINLHVPQGDCVFFDCAGDGSGLDVGGCHP